MCLFIPELLSRLFFSGSENTPESGWILHFCHHFTLSLIFLHDVLIDRTRTRLSHNPSLQALTWCMMEKACPVLLRELNLYCRFWAGFSQHPLSFLSAAHLTCSLSKATVAWENQNVCRFLPTTDEEIKDASTEFTTEFNSLFHISCRD